MQSKKLKVLAINSLPANGNAGLKMVMHILGTKVIPVPSLMLTGIGSIKGINKYPLPFEEMLHETLALARDLDEKLIMYVGYLGNASQIKTIKTCIETYKDIIEHIVVDPVCGDNGRSYVAQEIIERWGTLVELADFCLPNITEVALLTKKVTATNLDNNKLIKDFTTKFPKTHLIITSVEEGEHLSNYYLFGNELYKSKHEKIAKNYGGSGDAFASYLINFHFFQNLSIPDSIEAAGEAVKKAIQNSMEKKEAFLMLDD